MTEKNAGDTGYAVSADSIYENPGNTMSAASRLESYPVKAIKVPRLFILGIRGIPGAHGGFESFAEQLCKFLEPKGWDIRVYCQEEDVSQGRNLREETWMGVTRIIVPSKKRGSGGSVLFDFRCILHALRQNGNFLVLGYNTAVFLVLMRILGKKLVINMDGIEWKRPKWSPPVQLWFRINERFAVWFGSKLVADHPLIQQHLLKSTGSDKIEVIPYAAARLVGAAVEPLVKFGLEPRQFCISISRIEPENSQLEIVTAFSASERQIKLVILGRMDVENRYHQAVREAAGPAVLFPGAIYDKEILASLRFHALAYCHGHTVGGTNPSLVEALGAGNAVIAHDNPFNRWTAGEGQFFFRDVASCMAIFDKISSQPDILNMAQKKAVQRYYTDFTPEKVYGKYENMLSTRIE